MEKSAIRIKQKDWKFHGQLVENSDNKNEVRGNFIMTVGEVFGLVSLYYRVHP